MNRLLKFIIVFVLLIISLSSISAKQEIWMDASFYADTEIIPSKFKSLGYFSAYDNANAVGRVGPAFTITYFPFDIARIGLIVSAHTQFPIGCISGTPIPLFSQQTGFFSHHFDYRQDFAIGIAYNQMFGDLVGIFLDASVALQLNRVASNNNKNNNNFEYYQFATTNLVARLGLLNKSDSVYFKIGGAVNYDIKNKAGINYALFAGCGLIF